VEGDRGEEFCYQVGGVWGLGVTTRLVVVDFISRCGIDQN
jgi:hypothetical protein